MSIHWPTRLLVRQTPAPCTANSTTASSLPRISVNHSIMSDLSPAPKAPALSPTTAALLSVRPHLLLFHTSCVYTCPPVVGQCIRELSSLTASCRSSSQSSTSYHSTSRQQHGPHRNSRAMHLPLYARGCGRLPTRVSLVLSSPSMFCTSLAT